MDLENLHIGDLITCVTYRAMRDPCVIIGMVPELLLGGTKSTAVTFLCQDSLRIITYRLMNASFKKFYVISRVLSVSDDAMRSHGVL